MKKNPPPPTYSLKKIFYSTKWYISTDEYEAGFKAFIDYLTDTDARKIHESKIREEVGKSIEGEDEFIKNLFDMEEYKDVFGGARASNIYKAYSALSRQSTVIISTLFETFIQEFFTCIFCLFPQRMYNFLILSPENSLKGKIDLNDVLSANNPRVLVLNLAKKASEQAAKGKFSQILSNLQELTKNEIDHSIVEKMEPILEERNKIVHEFTYDDIKVQTVMDYYSTFIEVIEHVEIVAEKIGIETDKGKE
jgi:hypothetical protein